MIISNATVTEIWDETPGLTGVRLSVDTSATESHQQPGQVIAIHTDHTKPRYMVLASAPLSSPFEILLGSEARTALQLGVGQSVQFSGPSGPGFPVKKAHNKDVLIFATGSAIAAVRPLIDLIRSQRSEFGRVNVYFGARTSDAFPYHREYDGWRKDRIDLSTSVSPEYVQTSFVNDPLNLDDAIAFVCGSLAMMDDVTTVLGQFGLGPDRVFRNW